MIDSAAMSKKHIEDSVCAELDKYKDRTVLEQYAIFMGKAQILEFGLKGLLIRRFYVSTEDTKRWTLGKTMNELRKRGLRHDFLGFLESIVEHRNCMAHEFLVNNAIVCSISNFSDRKVYGNLFRALYEIERIIILYDWCERNNEWLPRTPKKSAAKNMNSNTC